MTRILSQNSKKLGEVCEEPMIQDHEDCPDNLYSESGINWDHVAEYSDLEESQKEKYLLYIKHVDQDHDQAVAHIEDWIEWENWSEIVEGFLENCEFQEVLRCYMDDKRIQRDLEIQKTYIKTEEGVLEFCG